MGYVPAPGPAYGYSDRTPEQRERIFGLEAAAEQVFGNAIRASAWLYKLNPSIADGQRKVIDAASDSAEGYAEALAELERIRPTITPEPLPACLQPGGRKRRRRR